MLELAPGTRRVWFASIDAVVSRGSGAPGGGVRRAPVQAVADCAMWPMARAMCAHEAKALNYQSVILAVASD